MKLVEWRWQGTPKCLEKRLHNPAISTISASLSYRLCQVSYLQTYVLHKCVVKTTNSKCFCEVVNLNAILVIISLFRLPLPVALQMLWPVVVQCVLSVPLRMSKDKRWHWHYWDLREWKEQETDSLWTSCAASHYYYFLRKIGD